MDTGDPCNKPIWQQVLFLSERSKCTLRQNRPERALDRDKGQIALARAAYIAKPAPIDRSIIRRWKQSFFGGLRAHD